MAVRVHNAHLLLLGRCQAEPETIREPLIVGIKKRDPFAPGSANAGVARRLRAAVLVMAQVMNPWIVLCQRSHDFFRVIARAVVRNQDFQIGNGLGLDARDG